MGEVIRFPAPARDDRRGVVHVMPCEAGGYFVSHESSSGSSWGELLGPFDHIDIAIGAASHLASRQYGGCPVDIWPLFVGMMRHEP
jgi:hypothetical protein